MMHRVSHRYYRLTRLFVTGMGAAMLLPWLIIIGRSWGNSPAVPARFSGDPFRFARLADLPFLALFVGMWLLLLFFIFLFEWVNEWFNDDEEDQLIWRTIMVFVMVLLLFPLNRMLLYHPAAAPLFAPARGIFNALFNFTDGSRPENGLILFYILSWLFAIWVTSNALDYFRIGNVFQMGIICNLIATGWLARNGESELILFLPFVICGLGALAVSQIDTKLALGYHSQGGRFSNQMWSQFAASIGGVLLAGTLVASLIRPAQIKAFFSLFGFVWQGILLVLRGVLQLIFFIAEPLVKAIFDIVASLIGDLEFDANATNGSTDGEAALELPTFSELIVNPNFRYIFIAVMIIMGLFIVWVVLNRTILKRYRDEAEERLDEQRAEDFDLFGDGVSRLRSWFDQFRGKQQKPLLAPDRIEDMYANICRLADRRGFPRNVSQSPDQYLDDLEAAFPGQDGHLAELTGGYMRSHYGEVQLPAADMRLMKDAYLGVVTSLDDEAEANPNREG